ncbi:TIGR02302 family protein [Epibacterium ulvae]|uniref:TIGR02302 family protein n=1 Tax=Epibacterium ulvae TaxID=1156985 RepID=A0A1G5PLI7_9RHOB|nr:DUF4175 domain-containing protein [Epibacterium ulvae]SCZ50061.1 TIGR02302 family protein [Epibacterium ulvae]
MAQHQTRNDTAHPARQGGLDPRLKPLRWQLRLTQMGLLSERLLRAYWPAGAIATLAAGLAMMGLQDILSLTGLWAISVLFVLCFSMATISGSRRMRWPSLADAIAHLDQALIGRPISGLLDEQALGADDPASHQLWQAHQARLQQKALQATAPKPDLNIAPADPFALRYVALMILAIALLFGSVWQVQTLARVMPGQGASAAIGPSWEGWIEPPRYTGLPVLYLNDQTGRTLTLPRGSQITLRFYGEVGALILSETVSARTENLPSAADPEQSFSVTQSGALAIEGAGGQQWQVTLLPDTAPRISVAGAADLSSEGYMTLPFTAVDDYGVEAGRAVIALDLLAVDRRHGLALDPEDTTAIELDLPLPLTGDRRDFTETLMEDFSDHVWANLPVVVTLYAQDAAGQVTETAGFGTSLKARRFFDPLAAAVVEQRRDLLWNRDNGRRVTQILQTLSHRPDEMFRDSGDYLQMRVILRRLDHYVQAGLTSPQQDEIAAALWELALKLEHGDLNDALERMRRAQERLSQAMRDGASDSEIAELMQELRDATQEYMQRLQQQAQNSDTDEDERSSDNALELTQDDLQAMMDRIQDLMEQGRMAEAEQALREFQQLMENMQVAEGQQGQNGSPGENAMEGLAETLREQQGLSDQAFRDLQQQFNPNAPRGEQGNPESGQQPQPGQDGEQGQGDQGQEGQSGSGQSGQGSAPGQGQSLADQQRSLRQELDRQQGALPFGSEPDGQAARDALDRAGRAMDQAEDALRDGDMAGAIDNQSDAMEALREGMRALGEAMAQDNGTQPGQGESGQANSQQSTDPLGRSGQGISEGGPIGDGEAYRRAWELLDEIRRRSGDGDRSPTERNYLERLLDRF